jgi:YegS/Rv2252/BmrU family lipid kinase
MIDKKKLLFIVNPISGDNQKNGIVEQIKQHLSSDFEYEICYTEFAGHATEITEQAILRNIDSVIAVGGDGSVNEVGKALVNTSVALGIIPSGSGNGFARHLKIPMEIKASIERLNSFNKKLIDTGSVNNNPFLATTGTGFDSHVAHKFATFGKRGFLSYMQVSTNEFISYQPKSYHITIDSKEIFTEAFLIVAANTGQYGNNVWISPSASVSDGLLNIGILQKFPATVLPDILLRLLNKTIENSRYYKTYRAKEITILDVDNFHIDGEPMESCAKMKIKVNPKSLEVIC